MRKSLKSAVSDFKSNMQGEISRVHNKNRNTEAAHTSRDF